MNILFNNCFIHNRILYKHTILIKKAYKNERGINFLLIVGHKLLIPPLLTKLKILGFFVI